MAMVGQDEDFIRCISRSQGRLHSFILSLVHNLNDADEILQETNLVVWRKFAQFDPAQDFVRWACQIAYYEVLKHRRRAQRKESLLDHDVLEALADEAMSTADAFDDKRQALAKCLESLPEADRRLVAMRFSDGATTESVASLVGRSVAAIYKAINRIQWSLVNCVRRRLAMEHRA